MRRRGHRRDRAVADRRGCYPGVQRRGHVGQCGEDRRLLRQHRQAARIVARRARGDLAWHHLDGGANRPGDPVYAVHEQHRDADADHDGGDNGAAGGDLTVGPNTKYGTPCVY